MIEMLYRPYQVYQAKLLARGFALLKALSDSLTLNSECVLRSGPRFLVYGNTAPETQTVAESISETIFGTCLRARLGSQSGKGPVPY